MFQTGRCIGQKDSHTEVFKIMHSVGVVLDLRDPAVKAFAGDAGFSRTSRHSGSLYGTGGYCWWPSAAPGLRKTDNG